MQEVFSRELQVDGHRVGYSELNPESASKIVLFQGWAMSKSMYAKVAESLAELGFHVQMVEFPGAGHSQGLEDMSPEGFRKWGINVFDQLVGEGEKVTLAGHSLGGAVATYVAAHRSKDCDLLFLMDPLGSPTHVDHKGRTKPMSERSHVSWALGFISENRGPQPVALATKFGASALATLAKNPVVFAKGTEACRYVNERSNLGKAIENGVPVALMNGNLDRIVSTSTQQELIEGLPVGFREFEGGHGSGLLAPSEITTTIQEAVIVSKIMRMAAGFAPAMQQHTSGFSV